MWWFRRISRRISQMRPSMKPNTSIASIDISSKIVAMSRSLSFGSEHHFAIAGLPNRCWTDEAQFSANIADPEMDHLARPRRPRASCFQSFSSQSFADSAYYARSRPSADCAATELFHDCIVVFRKRRHRVFGLNLDDLVAIRLQLSQKFWQCQ
jgi:hypothetical protein